MNTKTEGTAATDDAGNLDLVIPIYKLIENSSNYSDTIVTLWFYSKNEETGFDNDIANNNGFKSLKNKAKLLENTEIDGKNGILRNKTITAPLSIFWQ